MKPLLKVPRKLLVDKSLNVTPEVSERIDDGLAVADTAGIREGYEQGDLIHLHFEIWPKQCRRNGQKLCARFQYLWAGLKDVFPHPFELNSALHIRPLVNYEQGAVFVDVVECIQHKEEMLSRRCLTSLVRLCALDGCELALTQNLLQVTDFPIGVKVGLFFVDRKMQDAGQIALATCPNVRGNLARVLKRQLIDQMIQAGPDVVDHVPGHQSPFQRWLSRVNGGMQPILIHMEADAICGVFRGTKEVGLQLIEMYVCPFQFGLDADQGPITHANLKAMTNKTQKTRDGVEIPIPKRSDFLRNVKKAATPEKSQKRGPKKQR